MSDDWTRRLLSLNIEIVKADASLAVRLRDHFARSTAEKEAIEIKGQIATAVARLALLRRLRDRHLRKLREPG